MECDVPQAMIDYRADKMLEDYANRIQGPLPTGRPL